VIVSPKPHLKKIEKDAHWANKSKTQKKKNYSHEIKINQYLAQFLFYHPGTFKNRFPSLIYI